LQLWEYKGVSHTPNRYADITIGKEFGITMTVVEENIMKIGDTTILMPMNMPVQMVSTNKK
jgi:hypothetical protein